MELLTSPESWIAFATLTALELVLGIDNIIFISILVDKLPAARRQFARRLGLFLAMFMRIGLLAVLSWLAGMSTPLFTVPIIEHGMSGRDLILAGGGLFLVWKSLDLRIRDEHGAAGPQWTDRMDEGLCGSAYLFFCRSGCPVHRCRDASGF